VARFRLRFLLQEFDLAGPEVVIGRSPDCHITIEDPLVSRNHAKITISGEEAHVADLGSRNGVRINGRHIQGEALLKDGDRVRLGTQELGARGPPHRLHACVRGVRDAVSGGRAVVSPLRVE
jgi:pSer/pThr/pTyr-binding forkhead associated (FHA) protein